MKWTLLNIVAAAFLSVIPVAGARAQAPAGSGDLPDISDNAALTDVERQNFFADAFAACVARTRRAAAEEMLSLSYLSSAQARLASQISNSGCRDPSGADLRYPASGLVGRVAQYLVRERYANADLAKFAGLSDEAGTALGLVPRNNAEDMAFCVLRRDPQGARALIDTAGGSPQEAEAIRRIRPHLGPCTFAGARLQLDATAVRYLLATGLYRALSITAAAPGAG